jgi:hypothetical protein
MPEPSILDARLAEIDRRLRTIQTGLEPTGAETPLPAPVPLRAAPEPPELEDGGDEAERLVGQLRELGAAQERLLELHRDLLSQYAEALGRQAAPVVPVSVTAGPFADGGAVRGFEHALGGLPGVTSVTVREYLGGDRVALEVTLAAR